MRTKKDARDKLTRGSRRASKLGRALADPVHDKPRAPLCLLSGRRHYSAWRVSSAAMKIISRPARGRKQCEDSPESSEASMYDRRLRLSWLGERPPDWPGQIRCVSLRLRRRSPFEPTCIVRALRALRSPAVPGTLSQTSFDLAAASIGYSTPLCAQHRPPLCAGKHAEPGGQGKRHENEAESPVYTIVVWGRKTLTGQTRGVPTMGRA